MRVSVWTALFALLIAGAAAAISSTPTQSVAQVPSAGAQPVNVDAAVSQRFDSSVRQTVSTSEAKAAAEAGLLPAGTKSLLNTGSAFDYGDYMWSEKGVPAGPTTVWVDLRRQLVSVFRGGHEIGSAVIVYGTDDHQTPIGRFPVRSKHRDYWSRAYDAPMPFSLFITNDGVALHGSNVKWGHATHGCIGLPVEFARHLFDVANKGDVVQVVRSSKRAEERLYREF